MRRLAALGLPAGVKITLEVGVFAAATALAGRLAPMSLAAHQIALNIAALSRSWCRSASRRRAPCASDTPSAAAIAPAPRARLDRPALRRGFMLAPRRRS